VWSHVRTNDVSTTANYHTFAGMCVCIAVAGTVSYGNERETAHCWVSPRKDDAPMKRTYKIGKILGEGAYGKVFKAKRRSDGKKVALKMMNQRYTKLDEFERETKTLRALSENGGNEHVCRMYDVHNDDDSFYVAMELIEGGELFDLLIRHGAYSEMDAAKFLKQHGEALTYIHSKSFIHADLKPENLMMSSYDKTKANLKVVDFGCTLSTNELSSNAVLGTMGYMPPELFHEKPIITPAIDMFATGVIMYVLLTGSHPFDPTNCATDIEIKQAVQDLENDDGQQRLESTVMDERTNHLSNEAKILLRKLLHSDPLVRMTSTEFLSDSWVSGHTASRTVMTNSDKKLQQFWQRRFKAAILKKYAHAIGGKGTLSDRNLREIFGAIDTDGNHFLNVNEVKLALSGILNLKNETDISDLFRSIDLDGNGRVDFDEFKNILRETFDDGPGISITDGRFQTAVLQRFPFGDENITDQQLHQMFAAIDLNGDNLLQMDEVKIILGRSGMDKEQIAEWVDSIDTDLSGGVNFEEFKKAMKNKLVS